MGNARDDDTTLLYTRMHRACVLVLYCVRACEPQEKIRWQGL